MHLWVEEARTTVYVQNKISHSDLGNKTLKEMFIGENNEVNDLKIFGCPMYIHVPKEKILKLDSLVKKGIFVGYSDESKAYRIYIPCFHKIEVNKDVTFDEDATFNQYINAHVDEEEKETPRVLEISKPPIRDEEDPIPK